MKPDQLAALRSLLAFCAAHRQSFETKAADYPKEAVATLEAFSAAEQRASEDVQFS